MLIEPYSSHRIKPYRKARRRATKASELIYGEAMLRAVDHLDITPLKRWWSRDKLRLLLYCLSQGLTLYNTAFNYCHRRVHEVKRALNLYVPQLRAIALNLGDTHTVAKIRLSKLGELEPGEAAGISTAIACQCGVSYYTPEVCKNLVRCEFSETCGRG